MKNINFDNASNYKISITYFEQNTWSLKIACTFTCEEIALILNYNNFFRASYQ